MKKEFEDPQSLSNLPQQPNPLLGRNQELHAAQEQLLSDQVRLLSLLGPPGVGKTRLGMEVAANLREAFPDGVWFIDLAPLQDASVVRAKIANMFGIGETQEELTLKRVTAYLGNRQVLLFLDNFEGVLPAAIWLGELLEHTPGLKVLVTSRERLRIRWERILLVPPLRLPDLPLDLSALARNPAVELFVQRAKAIHGEFELSPENASAIVDLCTHLDGLPLAIELAAARASVLSPAEMLANLDDRFHVLGMGPLDLPERHQTLKAAIDWSYESLPAIERQFLHRLSVFSGGFSFQAAEMVGDCEALGLDCLDSLMGLVEKSMVNRTRGVEDEIHFSLLESIRAYLQVRLRTSGELDAASRRHACYYLELAERNFSEMDKRNLKASFDTLEIEHDNLRTALEWLYHAGEHTLGKRMAATLWYFWGWRGHISEGVHWLETFLDSHGTSSDEIYLRVLEGAGTLRGWQGDFDRAVQLLMEALRLAREQENPGLVIRTLNWLGWIFSMHGKTEQADWLAEMIEASSPTADPWDLSNAYLSLGSLLYEAGRDADAEREFTRPIEILQHDEKIYSTIYAENKLALLKQKKGQFQRAIRGMLSALNAAKQTNDLTTIMYCADTAALLSARWTAEKGAITRPDLEIIARILGAVDRWREILNYPRTPRERAEYLEIAQFVQGKLGEEAFLAKCNEGQSIAMERVIDDAIRLLRTHKQPKKGEQQSPAIEEFAVRLSERERQVLSSVAEGLSNQEIAKRLFITERTVRFHITSIFNKLGADNRAQAVAIASRLGIL